MISSGIGEELGAFARRHIPAGPVEVTPILAGRNNQGWRLDTSHGTYFLKRYFVSPDRDRLASERAFLAYAAACGITAVPRLLAVDIDLRAILFEFVEGTRFEGIPIGVAAVQAALAFANALNPPVRPTPPLPLPAASDACFSYAEHLAHVIRRLDNLRAGLDRTPVARHARQFLEEALAPAVATSCEQLTGSASPSRWSTPLPIAQRVVSPSDFGFHNALINPAGTIVFLDFEYSGWDDPLKLMCDFFAQPDCPVPLGHWDNFASGFAPLSAAHGATMPLRAWLPLYVAKWTCLMLNPLLPAHRDRLAFARRHEPAEQVLARAKEYFTNHPALRSPLP